MINLFLDSNILYSDPLMKFGNNKILFDKVDRVGGKIFICDVVYKEVLNNYEKQLKEVELESNKLNSKLSKLGMNTVDIQAIDVEAEVMSLEEKLKEYIRVGKYINIPVDNGILPQVIDRAIKRKKPFSKEKEEFRDCIIWLTYANKVESEKLDNCIFISRNVSDFCNKQGDLHEDFLQDTQRFKFHKDAYNVLTNEKVLMDSLETINDKFKKAEIVKGEFEQSEIFKEINDSVYSYLIGISEREIQYEFYPIYAEYIDLNSIDIKNIVKKDIDINTESLCISELGQIDIEACIDLKVYYDLEEYTVESTNIIIKASYIAKRKIEDIQNAKICESIDDIELDNICIAEIDPDMISKHYRELEENVLAEQMNALEEQHKH